MTQLDVAAALEALTLEEKTSLVLGSDFWHTAAVDRLGVPRVLLSDGPHGLRRVEDATTGLGPSAPATCFPTASALASSWNPALLDEVGHALAQEARSQGVSVLLGPGINLKRSPLCGRNFEYFSEDPHLTAELAVALVGALQHGGVGASVKHFAANNQETDRHRVSAEVDQRTLRELYLPAFERVVRDARPWTVMCAYNRVNGTPASQHEWLLTTVLRDEWGFEGLVVSDWGAVQDRVAALTAGLDLEMPPALDRSDRAVVEAVTDGALPVETLDRSVRRVLSLVARARDRTQQRPGPDDHGDDHRDDHHALARRSAAGCAVLLKNDGVLPLALGPGATVAAVGAFATQPRYQGAGSSQVSPTRVDVPLDELRAALPDVTVTHAPGFVLEEDRPDDALLADARAVAAQADVVVLFLGLPEGAEAEGYDRTHLDLPANQRAVVDAVAEVGARVVAVLANGSVVRLEPWEHRVGAVLECWLGGQAAGGAVADLLTGAVNPAGKLAETIPLRLADTPSYLDFPGDSRTVRYGEGLFVGYRGYDARELEVSRPFGFGLSYTTFHLDPPSVAVHGSVADGDLEVEVGVRVTNTGARRGAEVVQLYVEDRGCSVSRPVRELRGFGRVELDPGETGEVRLRLGERAFAFWSVLLERWAVEAGAFVLHVGTSSRDLPHRHELVLEAPPLEVPLDRDSTLTEWLAHPRGREALVATVERAMPGGAALLADEGLLRTIGAMPLSMLATFGTPGLTHDVLDELVAQVSD